MSKKVSDENGGGGAFMKRIQFAGFQSSAAKKDSETETPPRSRDSGFGTGMSESSGSSGSTKEKIFKGLNSRYTTVVSHIQNAAEKAAEKAQTVRASRKKPVPVPAEEKLSSSEAECPGSVDNGYQSTDADVPGNIETESVESASPMSSPSHGEQSLGPVFDLPVEVSGTPMHIDAQELPTSDRETNLAVDSEVGNNYDIITNTPDEQLKVNLSSDCEVDCDTQIREPASIPVTDDDLTVVIRQRGMSPSDSSIKLAAKRFLPEFEKMVVQQVGYMQQRVDSAQHKIEQLYNKKSDGSKKMKSQVWSHVVTIVLVEGKDLLAMDDNGLSDPYVKFKLGAEKYRSKYLNRTLNPKWLEQFDLHMFDDKILEITVWDKDAGRKDDFMGRCMIDLGELQRDFTHNLWRELEDGAGEVHLLLTITGGVVQPGVELLPKERLKIVRQYGLCRSFTNMGDIGHLTATVFKAQGIASADFGGKSDPFCVVELVNARLQTQTEYKTLTPEWNKTFTFKVKDFHSVLEITVYDEDRNKTVEFLGKVAIPLYRIKNGQRKWYQLKDKKLRSRAKGQVLVQLDVIYNPIKACVRTFNPKEEKYMEQEQKFKRAIFLRNVNRVRSIITSFVDVGKFLQSCFEWESKLRSLTAFMVFILMVYNFEPYMLPIALLLIFLKNYLVFTIKGGQQAVEEEAEGLDDDGDADDDDDDDKEKGEKKTFKERLHAIQEVCQMVQNGLGFIAALGERVKNTFNFTVPFLSILAIFILSVATVILFLVPLRWLIMAWGINKFTKKLRSPNAIPNNELVDFLSRIPSEDELMEYREFKPPSQTEANLKRKKTL